MRILIVSCVFPPEPVVSARTSAEIAEFLVCKGDNVTVISSFPNRPGGELYAGYKRRFWLKENSSKGYTLIRCYSALSGKSNLIRRFIENISFGATGGLAALFARRPDVIFSNTWPIFATGLIYFVARLRKIPLVISVQDVYPDSLIVQNRLSPESRIVRLLRAIDRGIARRCRAVIVIGERFRLAYTEHGVPSDRIHVVPNWSKPENMIMDEIASAAIRAKLTIPERAFLCLYAGNVGRASGVGTCIEAFHFLKQHEDMYLLIAGEGSQLSACKAMVIQKGISRIKFYSPWPMEETSAVLSAADCLLLPTQGQQSLVSVPSKMISYLFAAKPIVALSLDHSETAQIIKKAGCGLVRPPAVPGQLADALVKLRKLPRDRRNRMGQSGKTFALNHFSSNVCLPRIRTILNTFEVLVDQKEI